MSTGTSSIASTSTALKTASTAGLTKSEQDRKTIAQNFDQFLGLLTTQLKNQSPLDPLDANQFTQQLVQFSSVEQQLKTNDLLTKMAQNFGGSGTGGGKLTAASAAALIGTKVSVDASTTGVTPLVDGTYEAKWPVTIQSNYTNYRVSIADASGKEVYNAPWTPSGTGEQTFTWPGTITAQGAKIDPSTQYTIKVQGDLTTSNGTVKSMMATETSGVVKAVDLSGNEEMVQFGNYTIPLSKIKKVSNATS